MSHRESAPTVALVQSRVGTLLPRAKVQLAVKGGTRVKKEYFKPVSSLNTCYCNTRS